MAERKQRESSVSATQKKIGLCLMALHFLSSPQHMVQSFTPTAGLSISRKYNAFRVGSSSTDDEITRQLERAKELLAKSKAKMEEKEQEAIKPSTDKKESNGAVPFFAAKDASADQDSRKKKFTKEKNEETGLSTFDGDKMVELSESEEWEVRPLNQVFKNEVEDKSEDPFADRDVAASIFNLQRKMKTEDFRQIFDKRNRFIGEQ